jgi:hypothetical protein
MPSLKVLIVANACNWASWRAKIAAIKAFYGPLVELEIDIKQTNFTDMPTAQYPGTVTEFTPTGTCDVQGTDTEIDQSWFSENIGPMLTGYDICVFQVANVSPIDIPLGISFGRVNGVWCVETFVTDENFHYFLPDPAKSGNHIDLGNEAEVVIEHEISHALYALASETDNTHLYFYANQFPRVLTDIKLPNPSALTKLYQEVIADLQSELGIIKSQKSIADMDTTTQQAKEASTQFPPMIEKWITAVSQWEGANPALHNCGNLKYSTLTTSWGATKGPAASDGGHLCQFATDNAGEIALGNFLILGCQDELVAFHAPAARTLKGFTVIYAGNPPEGYVNGIIADMGVPGDTEISTFLS